MVESVSLFIRGNMRFDQPGLLAILDIHISFLDADLTGTNGFDLAPVQGEPSLESFKQKIFESRLAVGCHHLYVFIHHLILPQPFGFARCSNQGELSISNRKSNHPHFKIAIPASRRRTENRIKEFESPNRSAIAGPPREPSSTAAFRVTLYHAR